MNQYRLPKDIPSAVGVVGSRNFSRLEKVTALVNLLSTNATLYSGGAIGVDKTAEEAANARGLSTVILPVTREEWETYGKAAGPLRNERLVRAVKKRSGMFFIFVQLDEFDNITPGSKNVIILCEKYGVRNKIYWEQCDKYDF